MSISDFDGTQFDESEKTLLARSINLFASTVHLNAFDKGFWQNDRSDAECIALMHSELSEALEACRRGLHRSQCDKGIPISALEEELADCVIRIMDFAHHLNLDLGKALVLKHEYNTSRSYKHGKQF